MMELLTTKWYEILRPEFTSEYFHNMWKIIHEDAKEERIYPAKGDVFNALILSDYRDVKVVILGQDPFHGPNQAIGLAFGVPNDHYPKPPSLSNVFKEISMNLWEEGKYSNALDAAMDLDGSTLEGWAKQGILLLNTLLTVKESKPFSHKGIGWEIFTDKIINHLNHREQPIIFLLWGNAAKEKQSLITNSHHFVLTAAHPSPLSAHRGFFGCRHFSKVNEILRSLGKEEIDWSKIS